VRVRRIATLALHPVTTSTIHPHAYVLISSLDFVRVEKERERAGWLGTKLDVGYATTERSID
jgi:hypothetical protein